MSEARPSWDEFYLNMADVIASRSKDRSAKIGAVIVKDNAVLSMGYNGFPRGVDDNVEARHERPAKYSYTEHGERNSVYNAARHGIATAGATMYTQGVPCADCSRAVIQVGIKKLVAYWLADDAVFPMWKESCGKGYEMLQEAGVEVVIRRDLWDAKQVLRNS
jgi:dCMP deaminase